MSFLNLDKEKVNAIAKELNLLLADYHLYYQKLRNFHWNITGRDFFILHDKFEEMYNDTQVKIDEIAERILTLRFRPVSNYSEYLEKSSLKEAGTSLTDVEMIETILKDHSTILKQLRTTLNKAADANDEGTSDLLTGYIADIEKTSWMLDAWKMKTGDNLPKA